MSVDTHALSAAPEPSRLTALPPSRWTPLDWLRVVAVVIGLAAPPMTYLFARSAEFAVAQYRLERLEEVARMVPTIRDQVIVIADRLDRDRNERRSEARP